MVYADITQNHMIAKSTAAQWCTSMDDCVDHSPSCTKHVFWSTQGVAPNQNRTQRMMACFLVRTDINIYESLIWSRITYKIWYLRHYDMLRIRLIVDRSGAPGRAVRVKRRLVSTGDTRQPLPFASSCWCCGTLWKWNNRPGDCSKLFQ